MPWCRMAKFASSLGAREGRLRRPSQGYARVRGGLDLRTIARRDGPVLRLLRRAATGSPARGRPGMTRQPTKWSSGGTRRPLILMVLAAAIPVCLFGGWVAYLTGQEERAASRRAATAALERVAERVTAELSTMVSVLDTLSVSGSLDVPDLEMFYREAARLKASRPLWETVELTALDGSQLVNILRPFGSPLPPTADRDSFEEVVRTLQPVIGGIGPVGPVSGKRLIALRVPVLRDGELRYVLSTALVPDAVSAILRGAGAPEGWIGAIVDRSGNIIARTIAEEFELGRPASAPLRAAIARSPEGYYIGKTLEGIEVETVYRTLPHTGGWSVHLGVPTELLNEPVRRSTFILVSGGLASIALAAGLALLSARDIAQRREDDAARSARALQVSEERGAVAVEAAELGTWRWLVELDKVCGSERCRALLDMPRTAWDGAEWCWSRGEFLAAVQADDRAAVHDALQRCLSEGSLLDIEFRVQRQDGSTRWVRATGRAPAFTADRRDTIHGVIADIEPRKRAEGERAHLLRRLAQAQEEERRRIARELHDQVGQSVTGLSLGLKGLETALSASDAEAGLRERVQWLQGLTGAIGRDIHRAALDLRPTALDDLGLYGAVRTYAEDWSERFGIPIDVQILGDKGRLPPEIETAVYRIVQEALTNVLKHASARNVSVLFERKDSQLRLIIEDDGKGLDAQATGADQGAPRLGLSGIRERLALMGGAMTLESSPGAGTTLFIHIPTSSGPSGASP
jgi:two-component system, NarL family, sensor histidine kinase UhpB